MSAARRIALACALLAALVHPGARASCGSAFCMVNTNWNLQGFAPEPGLRLDLRYEYLRQDRPMSGASTVAVGQIPRDHDELRTLNRNLIATFDYVIDESWGVAATIPVADRSHAHIDNQTGTPLPEQWNFSRAGDLRVVGRRQWHSEDESTPSLNLYGVNFGLKLPTGSTRIANADGVRAERTLQPGTGTTDLLLGAYYARVLPASGSSWFVQAMWQSAMNRHEDYRPGARLSLDAGYRRELTDSIGLLVQLNALFRARDSGAQAEPEDSGGRFLFVSPGVSFALTPRTQVYGFVQKPLAQYVNGVQLVANWSAVIGVSARF